MADYIGITEAQSNPFAPLTSELVKQLRDNPIAIAQGATGAPRVQPSSAVAWAASTNTTAERNWVLARTASAGAGAVGTYAFAWRNSTATPPAFGGTVAGSQLRPAGFTSSGGVDAATTGTFFRSGDDIRGSAGTTASTFSGTWRCMGEAAQLSASSGDYPHTLWLRIS